MSQSRRMSLIESMANIAVGYGVAISAQVVLFPLFGVHIPLTDDLLIGACFTALSLVRSYALRRFFNRFNSRGGSTA